MTNQNGYPPSQQAGLGLTTSTKGLLAGLAVLAVLAIVSVIAVIATDPGGDESSMAAITTTVEATTPGAAAEDHPEPDVQPADSSTPPVTGAFPGAGGARPAGAEPLPTYVGRYSGLESAHLLTPTGNIGCDFQAADNTGSQGLCGVRSFNTPSSPLGCVQRHRDCKGRWIFPFENKRVGEPTDSSGTTGWMNQPANDGYAVPVAEYGKQYFFEDWVVASELNGLTVWNTSTGSGAFLSREKAERFDGSGGGDRAPGNGSGTTEAMVLGSAASNSRGFGTSQPREIHSGGSGSSTYAYDLTWRDWGSDRATATGLGRSPVDGVPITVVAFEPGQCGGQRAYTRVAYYGEGESFESASTLNACWE